MLKFEFLFKNNEKSLPFRSRLLGSAYSVCMGSKKKKPPRRSPNSSAKSRFPLGELSREKAKLRDKYLSKNKELCALKTKVKRLQENS